MSAEERLIQQRHKLAVADSKRLTELTEKVDGIGKSLERIADSVEKLCANLDDVNETKE